MSDDPVGDAIRAARYADAIMRRTAGLECHKKAAGGNMQSYWDWYSDQHYQGVHPESLYDFAHWYPKHIDPTADKQTVYDFAKNDAFAKGIPQRFVKYDGTPVTDHSAWNHDFHNPDPYVEYGEWQDQVGSPDNQKSRGGIGVLGEDGFDNPWEGDHGTYKPLPISQPPGHNGEGFDPDEHQDPFDPRLLGASRTAAVWDWKPYLPELSRQMKARGMISYDPDAWAARSEQGDHYTIRPSGSVFNDLPKNHPLQDEGDPEHWEVDHLPPEYGHAPDAFIGDIYGPTALNQHAIPVEGTHPHGFSSPQEAMAWVKARHPEEGFDPDEHQDPFDPRLIGASLRLAANEDLLGQLHDEFHDWYAEHGNERLNWAGRGPLGNWHQIENFLKDRYPEAHKGITTGKEEAGSLLDTGQLGPDGDYCPKCHGRGFHLLRTNEACPACDGSGKPDQPMAYATGQDAVDRLGYDPKEIAAGMLLLHNRTHSERSDLEQGDNDRLSEIARMRSQMQREGRLEFADIIRLAGDGMSWEDTMAHIDQVLGEGEKGSAQSDFLDAYYTSGPGAGTQPRDLIPLQYDENYCPDCERNVAEEGHEPGFLCAGGDDCTH